MTLNIFEENVCHALFYNWNIFFKFDMKMYLKLNGHHIILLLQNLVEWTKLHSNHYAARFEITSIEIHQIFFWREHIGDILWYIVLHIDCNTIFALFNIYFSLSL